MDSFRHSPPDVPRARSRNPGLRDALAGLVGIGGVGAADLPAHAQQMAHFGAGLEAHRNASEPKLVQGPRLASASVLLEDGGSFARVVEKNAVTMEEFSYLELHMERGGIPLHLQLRFAERVFGEGGIYRNQILSPNLDVVRLSGILGLVSRVSVALNAAYARGEKIRGYEGLFDITALRASTRVLRDVGPKGEDFCNAGLVRDAGHVEFVTDAHCVNVHEIKRRNLTLSPSGADMAVGHVEYRDHARWGIAEGQKLVRFDRNLTEDALIGKPIVSYSAGPDGAEKVHFSLYLPATDQVRLHIVGDAAVAATTPYLHQVGMMLKPFGESEVIGETVDGNRVIGASGSSGSIVAVAGPDPVFVGTYVSQRVLFDGCAHLCHPVGFLNKPSVFAETLDLQRRGIALNMLSQSKPFAP